MSTSPKSNSTGKDVKAFADHIGELRLRMVLVALAFIAASSLAYQFRDILVQVVLAPLGDQKLIYLTPAGGFSFIFQITMYAGALVTAPLFVYQLYRFVQPALPLRARRYSVRIVLASTLLMVAGVGFGYFVAVPAALHFLTAFAGTYIQANLTAESYLNFLIAYVVGLGILFQLPLLLVFWNWINPLGPKKLLASQKFIILFAFVAAAIITPTPDPTNQAMIAVPIILIYQIGVIAVMVINRGRHRREGRATALNKTHVPVMPTPPSLSDPSPVIAVQPRLRRVQTIDGVRRPIRSTDMRPIMRRAQPRLVAPPRSAPTTPRGLNVDDVI